MTPAVCLVWSLLCLYLSLKHWTLHTALASSSTISLIPPSASKLLVSQASPPLGFLDRLGQTQSPPLRYHRLPWVAQW